MLLLQKLFIADKKKWKHEKYRGGETILKENWYALFIVTQKDISVEQALKCMGVKTNYTKKDPHDIVKETKRMVDLKRKGYSYRDISRMYGLNYSTIRYRIMRVERK